MANLYSEAVMYLKRLKRERRGRWRAGKVRACKEKNRLKEEANQRE